VHTTSQVAYSNTQIQHTCGRRHDNRRTFRMLQDTRMRTYLVHQDIHL
jgi:hypothetical protein